METDFENIILDVIRIPKIPNSKKERLKPNAANKKGRKRNGRGKKRSSKLDKKLDKAGNDMLPMEFRSIVSKLDKISKKEIIIEKEQGKSDKKNNAVYRVTKRTYTSDNELETAEQFNMRESEVSVIQDLIFSDDKIPNSKKPELRTFIIKNNEKEFAKFGVKNVPKEFLTIPQKNCLRPPDAYFYGIGPP
jgi:hypothetical protein